jgi:hypothetical protein
MRPLHVDSSELGEAGARIEPAPVRSCPVAEWREPLATADPVAAVLRTLWPAAAPHLPRTLAILERSLKSVLLVESPARPPSLLYVLTRGEARVAFRGFAPAVSLPHPVPPEWGAFHRIHDGWVDFASSTEGPSPSSRWYFLSEIVSPPVRQALRRVLDPDRFLVVCHDGLSGMLGFDLSQPEPLCFRLRRDVRPEVIPDPMETLDGLLAGYLEGVDARE